MCLVLGEAVLSFYPLLRNTVTPKTTPKAAQGPFGPKAYRLLGRVGAQGWCAYIAGFV